MNEMDGWMDSNKGHPGCTRILRENVE
jgi:hypothetical protein